MEKLEEFDKLQVVEQKIGESIVYVKERKPAICIIMKKEAE